MSGFGFRVSGIGHRVSGIGIRVSGFGYRDAGFGYRDSGSGTSAFCGSRIAPCRSVSVLAIPAKRDSEAIVNAPETREVA